MPRFDSIARYAADGCLVKPLFHQFIQDPKANTNLNLLVERPMPRQPDGWFHASQHPRMSERDLCRLRGDRLDDNAPDRAVTAASVWQERTRNHLA